MPEKYKIQLVTDPGQPFSPEAVSERNAALLAKKKAAAQKYLKENPEDPNATSQEIFERARMQKIANGEDASYYDKMIQGGKDFTKGALSTMLMAGSVPSLGINGTLGMLAGSKAGEFVGSKVGSAIDNVAGTSIEPTLGAIGGFVGGGLGIGGAQKAIQKAAMSDINLGQGMSYDAYNDLIHRGLERGFLNRAKKAGAPTIVKPSINTSIKSSIDGTTYEAPTAEEVELVVGDDIMQSPGQEVGSKMIKGTNAKLLSSETAKKIWNKKISNSYLQDEAKIIDNDPRRYAPELYNAKQNGDEFATEALNEIHKISNGKFRIGSEPGKPQLDYKDTFVFSNLDENSYPLSIVPYVRATIRSRKLTPDGMRHYKIYGGTKGVSDATDIIEGLTAQRPLKYGAGQADEIWTGQYVTNNNPTAAFYSKFGTQSGVNAIDNIIDKQVLWDSTAKEEAHKLNGFIYDELKKLSTTGRGREDPLTTSIVNPILLKNPLPQGYNFPGDLTTGKIDQNLLGKRFEIEQAMNRLNAMLLNKNSIGTIELSAKVPNPKKQLMVNYRGDWWKENILGNKVAPYDISIRPENWVINANNKTKIGKNVDTMSHMIDGDQAGVFTNIRDAINGPYGTDLIFGQNIWGLKFGGILNRK